MVAALVSALSFGSAAGDAVAFDVRRVGHPGSATTVHVAGVPVTCLTPSGGAVSWVVTGPSGPLGRLPGGAGVTSDPGPGPHVYIRTDLFAVLPAKLQLYVVLHECAHFHLPRELNTELNADCFAVRTGVRNRWFGTEDVDALRKALIDHRWGHPAGAIHAENLEPCLRAR